jgi:hypothetical protein
MIRSCHDITKSTVPKPLEGLSKGKKKVLTVVIRKRTEARVHASFIINALQMLERDLNVCRIILMY